jgi:5'-methylthioadenosine phosphorylase
VSEPPRAQGDRLAVVHGHSVPAGTTLDALRDDVLFLPRHGTNLETPAHLVDHAASVRGICDAGCGRVLALGSVGSLRADLPPRSLLCPDDFLAPGIAPSFYADVRGHTVPGFDPGWRELVADAWRERGELEFVDGGVYAQVRGPRFETPAEVGMLARDADVVSG